MLILFENRELRELKIDNLHPVIGAPLSHEEKQLEKKISDKLSYCKIKTMRAHAQRRLDTAKQRTQNR